MLEMLLSCFGSAGEVYAGLYNNIWFALAFFAVGALLLIKGGDWFVDSASNIAKRFRVPEIIIGATVVSIGTTLPEVMSLPLPLWAVTARSLTATQSARSSATPL